jgi:hypothetical protein
MGKGLFSECFYPDNDQAPQEIYHQKEGNQGDDQISSQVDIEIKEFLDGVFDGPVDDDSQDEELTGTPCEIDPLRPDEKFE